MLRRCLLLTPLLLVLTPFALQALEIGAFFTQYNTYLYFDGPQQGKRILVKPRQVLAVEDFTLAPDDRLWYLAVLPGHLTRQEGEGWVPLAPHELLEKGSAPVEVFLKLPREADEPVATRQVPAADIKLLSVSRPGKLFPQVEWNKVRFSTQAPARAWVRDAVGIFRPGVTETFLSRVYADMVARNVEAERLQRLMLGVVHRGDAPRDVRWALGEPLRVQEDRTGQTTRVTWQFPAVVVQFENDVVKQIN